MEANTNTVLDGCLAEGENPQVRMEGVLVPLIVYEESPMFYRALVLVQQFHAPHEG
jgi:hypothetical protein